MKRSNIVLVRFALRTITAVILGLAAVLILSRYRQAWSWPATLGRVERVVIARAGDPGDSRAPGERFRPEVRYTYSVGGNEYDSHRIGRFEWIYPTEERARRYLRRHDISDGARVSVYYNPQNPDSSLLVRTIPWRRVEVLLGILVLVVLPVGVVAFSIIDLLRGGESRREDRGRGPFF
jgi:hypothetical protein